MTDYIKREDAIYAIKKAGGCIGIHDCFETRCGTCQINFALSAVNDLPAAGVAEEQEITLDDVLKYCKAHRLIVISEELFYRLNHMAIIPNRTEEQ